MKSASKPDSCTNAYKTRSQPAKDAMRYTLGRLVTAMSLLALSLTLIQCSRDRSEAEPGRNSGNRETQHPRNRAAEPEGDDVQAARKDLAGRLQVGQDSIELVRHEEVTWRDGSLGCPQPGASYTQALVNGVLIVLRINNTDYEYHAGGGRPPFYCPTPEAPLPAGGSSDI